MEPESITRRWRVSERIGEVSGAYVAASHPTSLMVLGHGAGADMHHAFMVGIAEALAEAGVSTLRYQFPFTEAGRKRPDVPAVLQATVRSAVAVGKELAPSLPLWAGGKSMGGRISALACGKEALSGVRGLVFFGFPLHPAGKPGTARAETVRAVQLPMLFLQGSRDRMADLTLMRPLCTELGARATLHVIDDADHGFAVPKRRGMTFEDMLAHLALVTAAWIARHT